VSIDLYTLRVANKTLSKHQRAKKTRVCQEGTLTIEDTQDVLAQKYANEQARRDKRSEREEQKKRQPSRRYYDTCEKSSYNTRTYQEDIDRSNILDAT
jgi:hypothetical protein